LAELGVDAIWVSNHGGRQLDGSVAAVDALTDVVRAVGSRIPVILDSGVRRGSDVLKAVASGAQAVAMGRATLYGASVAGEAGAARALDILQEELRRAMQLCGVPRIAELGPDILRLPTSSERGSR
jgi:isopentenyl diphosphate isomerase/L-lactate dehydrogenase-like FMN-dependent dehydrogenase